ncbi:hypothetical protein OSB04_007511 [Centaurea solstitialis]|uniref:Uncharacterized protein n=1 Tax=Centaurea solstitialis TaxID=347529 RepID=A0AA38TXT0_9ASTR|nr:hypothetical protein OSB04_007511 [Centaurea solstitialis]
MDQFKIVTRVGWVTHLLRLPSEFSRMRNTLNVSRLEKCSTGESSHDLFDSIQVNRNPRKVDQSLRIKDIGLVKVQLEHRNELAWTWEPEAERRSNYTEIFHNGRAIGEIGEFLSEVARRRLLNRVSKVEIVFSVFVIKNLRAIEIDMLCLRLEVRVLNNSYKRCRPKTARIFDRAANIGCDPPVEITPWI